MIERVLLLLILGNQVRAVGELIVATGWGDFGRPADQPGHYRGGEACKLLYTTLYTRRTSQHVI